MDTLIAHGAKIPTLPKCFPPIFLAAQTDNISILTKLISLDSNLEVTYKGASPLQVASQCGHEKMVTALIEKGALVDNPAAIGSAPLLLAIAYGHLACVKALIAGEADLSRRNANGFTPLEIAINANKPVISEYIRDSLSRKNGMFFSKNRLPEAPEKIVISQHSCVR